MYLPTHEIQGRIPRGGGGGWIGWLDAPVEASGSADGLRIHLGVLTVSKTGGQHLPKRERTSKNSRCFTMGSTEADEVVLSYSEDPYVYLASQHNDHRMILRFGRHRHACKYS